jgi:hypothetical protein
MHYTILTRPVFKPKPAACPLADINTELDTCIVTDGVKASTDNKY